MDPERAFALLASFGSSLEPEQPQPAPAGEVEAEAEAEPAAARWTAAEAAEIARRRRVLGGSDDAVPQLSDEQILQIADPGPEPKPGPGPKPERTNSLTKKSFHNHVYK